MKQLTHYFLFISIIFYITACGTDYDIQKRDDAHNLINPDTINTYAFLGNSITHDGRYHSYFELFLLTRYPNVDFKFINAGVAGDQAGIALGRLEDDLLNHKPDVVMAMFGMNDIGRNLYGKENLTVDSMIRKQKQNLSNYEFNLDSMVTRILKTDADLVLFTPSIYEQNAKNLDAPNQYGCNDALQECSYLVKEIQKKHDVYLADHYSVMDSINTLLQKENPDTTIVGPDRVHPQDIGHFIMAANIIEQLGYTPLVASVEISISDQNVAGINASVNGLLMNDGKLTYNYKPETLPFPTKSFNEIAAFINFNQKLNQEYLSVKGLSAGTYTLNIDSIEISVFTEKEMEEGINLNMYVTPQQHYSSKIANLVEQKRKLYSNKLRNIAFIEYFYAPQMREASDSEKALEILDERLQKDAGKSYYDYLEGQVNIYKDVKSKLPEIQNEIDSLNNEINILRENIPEYKITLEKMRT
jgi:lysophospholipase L1-like esterase